MEEVIESLTPNILKTSHLNCPSLEGGNNRPSREISSWAAALNMQQAPLLIGAVSYSQKSC